MGSFRIEAPSQPWIHGLALEGQHAEDALVDPAERLPGDESLQRLQAQSKLAQGQRSLGPQAAGARGIPLPEPRAAFGPPLERSWHQ